MNYNKQISTTTILTSFIRIVLFVLFIFTYNNSFSFNSLAAVSLKGSDKGKLTFRMKIKMNSYKRKLNRKEKNELPLAQQPAYTIIKDSAIVNNSLQIHNDTLFNKNYEVKKWLHLMT